MATADKLITVAENVPKVYHSGQLNIVKNAECLKNNKNGSAMLLDDVSPVTHEMGVRVRGKNLFNISSSRGFESMYAGLTNTINGNEITVTSTADRTACLLLGTFLKGTYTLSLNTSETKVLFIQYGESISSLTRLDDSVFNPSYTFSISETRKLWLTTSLGVGETTIFTDIQIELGTTAIAYTPYVPDLTAVKVSRCGKNLTNSLTDINAEQNSFVISRDNGIVTLGSKNVITYSSMAHLCDRILSAGTYTFSFDCTIENIKKCKKPNYVHLYVDNKFVANVIYNINKDGTYHRSFNFKITKKSRVLIRFYFNIDSITEASDTIITKAMFSNVQLELGSTATDYEPYITPTDYTPTADGTVEGVTSLYPNTTLMTDTEGVLIDCDYYKDIDKTFNELTTSVALSGGDS